MPGEVESAVRNPTGPFRVTNDSDLPFSVPHASSLDGVFLFLSLVSREARAAAEIAHLNPYRFDFRYMPPLHVFCAAVLLEREKPPYRLTQVDVG